MKVHSLLCPNQLWFQTFPILFYFPCFTTLDLVFSISSVHLRIPMRRCQMYPVFCSPPLLSSLSTYYFSNVTACNVSLIALNPVRMLAAGHQKHSWRWGAGVGCHVKSPPSLPLGKDLNLKHFQSITVQERTLTMFCNTDWFHKYAGWMQKLSFFQLIS